MNLAQYSELQMNMKGKDYNMTYLFYSLSLSSSRPCAVRELEPLLDNLSWRRNTVQLSMSEKLESGLFEIIGRATALEKIYRVITVPT